MSLFVLRFTLWERTTRQQTNKEIAMNALEKNQLALERRISALANKIDNAKRELKENDRIKKIVELFDTGMVQPSPKFWEVVHSIGVSNGKMDALKYYRDNFPNNGGLLDAKRELEQNFLNNNLKFKVNE